MALHNVIQNKLSPEDRQAIDEHLKGIEQIIQEKLVTLNPDDRRKYGSINEQNKLFVNKTRELLQVEPQQRAPEVDWQEFEADFTAREFLETRYQRIERLAQLFESTKILHDYDNYSDSLAQYSYLQYRAGRNIPGAVEMLEALKYFFPRNRKKLPEGENLEAGDNPNPEA